MKTVRIFLLSYVLLMTSAFAGTPREAFVNKMEKQTTSIFKKAKQDLNEKTDKELTNTYGDYVLAVFLNNEDTVANLGLTIEDGIRANLEKIFSVEGKELIMKNLDRFIDEAGSVKKFKKLAKRKMKGNLKHRGHDHGPIEFVFHGIGQVLQTVFLIITFPIWFPMLLIILDSMG